MAEYAAKAQRGMSAPGADRTRPAARPQPANRTQPAAQTRPAAQTQAKNPTQRTYMCIDLKSFYASVECADRGLDPFTTDLVVADVERSENTICLAITPSMKAKGVPNRCRVREIPSDMPYIAALPRMRRYMEVSRDIYRTYLTFVAPSDIYPYSIDECFVDLTPYLAFYGLDARALAKRIASRVRDVHGIAATAGLGPNLFLAKVALDITAKNAADGIGELGEGSFRRQVWFHHPITDIWGIGRGIAGRLARRGIYDLAGICAERPEVLRHMFGKNAEHLIDHAWGQEPCTIADIRAYEPRGHSMTNGQVLMRDYSVEEAETVLREMIFASCLELVEKGLACDGVGLHVGYSHTMFPREAGMPMPAMHTGGQRKLGRVTSSERHISEALLALFRETVAPRAKIRRVNINLTGLVPERFSSMTLFDDPEAERRERDLADAMVAVRGKFGANALLKGTSLKQGANAHERNMQIGGHRA